MRKIGSTNDIELAKTFRSYLFSLGIETHDTGEQSPHIWILAEDDLLRAKKEFYEFQQNPHAEKYKKLAQMGDLRKKSKHREEQNKKQRARYIDVRTEVFNRAKIAKTPVTLFLLLGSLAFFILQFFDKSNVLVRLFSISQDHWAIFLALKVSVNFLMDSSGECSAPSSFIAIFFTFYST